MPPLLPVRDRFSPPRQRLVLLDPELALERLAEEVVEDLTVDQRPASLDALAEEVAEDLTVDEPPQQP